MTDTMQYRSQDPGRICRPGPSRPAAAAPSHRDPYRHCEPALRRMAAAAPDDPVRRVLRNELAVAFAPVCRNVVRRFRAQGEPPEDLEQVAMIGLLKALEQFRPPPGSDPISAFLGYAAPTIAGEVQRHFRDHCWTLRVPRAVKEIQARLWRAVVELGVEYGRAPRPSELAAHLGVPRELVIEAVAARSARFPTSTDFRSGGDRLVDELGTLDRALAGVEHRIELRTALRQLPERSVRILALHFFGDLTQSQIADQLGISQMHVSRLLGRSLATLRADLAA